MPTLYPSWVTCGFQPPTPPLLPSLSPSLATSLSLLLKGLLKIYKEVKSVIEANSDVVRVLNRPEGSNDKEGEEGETHARDTEQGGDRKPNASFSQVLEICLKSFKQGPVKHA